MSVFKVIQPTSPFELIPRETLQSEALTCEALGLLCHLQSLPLDWTLNMAYLEKRLQAKREKTRRVVKVLLDAGYMVRIKRYAEKSQSLANGKKVKGGSFRYDYFISTDRAALPRGDNCSPEAEYPAADGPSSDNPSLFNRTSKQENTLLKSTHTPDALPSRGIVDGDRIIINGECVATRSSMQVRIEHQSRENGISLEQAWQSISQEILDYYANHHESPPPKKAARQGRGEF